MKRKIIAIVLTLVLTVTSLSSCTLLSMFLEKTVKYDFGVGGGYTELKVDFNSQAPELSAPARSGYKFIGWYTDTSFSETYDFKTPVGSDITIYAHYVKIETEEELDADLEELLNEITLNSIKAAVTLTVEKYDITNSFFGSSKTNLSQSTGSGVIFADDNTYYYILTNNHVVATDKDATSIVVSDYKLNPHSAELVVADPEYDLAVVRIAKNHASPLAVLAFNTTVPAVDETVLAIGTPGGQPNAVTIGRVEKYDTVTITGSDGTQSKVAFPVIWHSAPMAGGSSGGVLIDTGLKIVGINFAAASQDGEFAYGLSVPTEKIMEFLSKHELSDLL